MSEYLAANTVAHKRGCQRFEVGTFRGKHDDLIARCHDCGATAVLSRTPRPEPEPDTAPTFHSGQVCAEHYNPVNWRGRGCKACDQARAEGRRKRKPAPAWESA